MTPCKTQAGVRRVPNNFGIRTDGTLNRLPAEPFARCPGPSTDANWGNAVVLSLVVNWVVLGAVLAGTSTAPFRTSVRYSSGSKIDSGDPNNYGAAAEPLHMHDESQVGR